MKKMKEKGSDLFFVLFFSLEASNSVRQICIYLHEGQSGLKFDLKDSNGE